MIEINILPLLVAFYKFFDREKEKNTQFHLKKS